MKPYEHAKISAKKYGGIESDYQSIHDFFDQTKAHIPDMRHRMILHNSFGIFLAEQIFGEIEIINGKPVKMPYIVNSDGNKVQVRDIGEDHVLQDLGTIPTLVKCFENVKLEKWMGGLLLKKESSIEDMQSFLKLSEELKVKQEDVESIFLDNAAKREQGYYD